MDQKISTAKLKLNIIQLILIAGFTAPAYCFADSIDNNEAPSTEQALIAALPENDGQTNPQNAALSTIDSANTTESAAVMPNINRSSLNPYQQLAHLAFKGKSADGINSYSEAAAIYCKRTRDAADANAAFAVGWMYMNGRGVEKNIHTAALFFAKAQELGNERAKIWLQNSQGNPNLAIAPSCLAADPEPLQTVEAQTVEEKILEAEIKPFYVKGPIYKLVSKLAPKYQIEPDLAMAFIAVESNFNAKATSAKNAQGLMQLIPETASRFNVKNAYDPEQNIKGGLAYLKWLLTYFEGDVQLVAAAYNAGENAVNRYSGIPPYPETKKYVQKIASLYTRKRHPYEDNLNVGKSTALAKMQRLR